MRPPSSEVDVVSTVELALADADVGTELATTELEVVGVTDPPPRSALVSPPRRPPLPADELAVGSAVELATVALDTIVHESVPLSIEGPVEDATGVDEARIAEVRLATTGADEASRAEVRSATGADEPNRAEVRPPTRPTSAVELGVEAASTGLLASAVEDATVGFRIDDTSEVTVGTTDTTGAMAEVRPPTTPPSRPPSAVVDADADAVVESVIAASLAGELTTLDELEGVESRPEVSEPTIASGSDDDELSEVESVMAASRDEDERASGEVVGSAVVAVGKSPPSALSSPSWVSALHYNVAGSTGTYLRMPANGVEDSVVLATGLSESDAASLVVGASALLGFCASDSEDESGADEDELAVELLLDRVEELDGAVSWEIGRSETREARATHLLAESSAALLLGVVEEGDGKKDSLVDESVEVGAGSDEVEGES